MSSISTYKLTYKSKCLSSISRGAVSSLIQSEAYLRTLAATTGMPTYQDTQRTSRGVLVFLVWLQIWLDWLRGLEYAAHPTRICEPALVNRRCRRMVGRKVPPVRSFNILFHLCGKTLSRTQFLELMCMLMPLGRVRIYGLSYWGPYCKGALCSFVMIMVGGMCPLVKWGVRTADYGAYIYGLINVQIYTPTKP